MAERGHSCPQQLANASVAGICFRVTRNELLRTGIAALRPPSLTGSPGASLGGPQPAANGGSDEMRRLSLFHPVPNLRGLAFALIGSGFQSSATASQAHRAPAIAPNPPRTPPPNHYVLPGPRA